MTTVINTDDILAVDPDPPADRTADVLYQVECRPRTTNPVILRRIARAEREHRAQLQTRYGIAREWNDDLSVANYRLPMTTRQQTLCAIVAAIAALWFVAGAVTGNPAVCAIGAAALALIAMVAARDLWVTVCDWLADEPLPPICRDCGGHQL